MSELTVVQGSPVGSARVSAEARWSRRTGLGARLRNARTEARKSLADTAAGLTSVAYLSRLEAGERCPSPVLAAALSQRLGLRGDLTLVDDRTSAGLTAELAHADLLLATGRVADATWVSAELVEVASGIGEREIAHAARIVNAYAHAAAGDQRTALRAVRPLSRGPLGTLALVAQARFQLDLGQYYRALEAGQRAADRIAVEGQVSFGEAAALAVTVCDSYQALDRLGFAAHVAYLALKHLPGESDLGSTSTPRSPGSLSFRSGPQSVVAIEQVLAELQMTRLRADIELLRSYGPPRKFSDAPSTFGIGRKAVS